MGANPGGGGGQGDMSPHDFEAGGGPKKAVYPPPPPPPVSRFGFAPLHAHTYTLIVAALELAFLIMSGLMFLLLLKASVLGIASI